MNGEIGRSIFGNYDCFEGQWCRESSYVFKHGGGRGDEGGGGGSRDGGEVRVGPACEVFGADRCVNYVFDLLLLDVRRRRWRGWCWLLVKAVVAALVVVCVQAMVVVVCAGVAAGGAVCVIYNTSNFNFGNFFCPFRCKSFF